jgi:histidine triad (HIT) family protein
VLARARTIVAAMATIFTKIIDGDIPGTFVWRDDVCVALLSINPLADGHVLVVPRAEVAHWIDLPAATNEHLMRVAHTIGLAQQVAYDCERVGLIIAGYEVPHTHVHVIPTTHMGQLSFANAAASISRESLDEHAGRIRTALHTAGAPGVV